MGGEQRKVNKSRVKEQRKKLKRNHKRVDGTKKKRASQNY